MTRPGILWKRSSGSARSHFTRPTRCRRSSRRQIHLITLMAIEPEHTEATD